MKPSPSEIAYVTRAKDHRMLQLWKVPHIMKGILTSVPILQACRLRVAATGGTNSPWYCYRLWLRHLTILHSCGFRIRAAHVGELGPGDSVGAGLAALLSGAQRYIGLDAIPYSANVNLQVLMDELVRLFSSHEPIPEYHDFPSEIIDWTEFHKKIGALRHEIRRGVNSGDLIRYRAPWSSADDVDPRSLDLIFSEGVLQCVDSLEETYRAMFLWLKPGGYSSHAIGFSAGYLSPFWNGHWAYSDLQWRLVRGSRPFLLNREPMSTHVNCAKKVGFEVILVNREYYHGGLEASALARRFRGLEREDLRTSRAVMILRKPLGRS